MSWQGHRGDQKIYKFAKKQQKAEDILLPWQGYREENPALGGNSVRSFLIDSDHIIDSHQSKELNATH